MKFHDTLNEKIWDLTTEDLIPEVKEKLEEIAETFIEFLEIPIDAVLDKVITGSSASYNYNEFSDLDLHIIVDYDKVHEDCPLVNGYLNSLKKQFNDNHDIFIHGVPVELYAEQKDQGTVHNGLYSLQTGWIDKPQKIEPTDNDAAVEAKFNEIKDMVDKCDDSEEATELLEKIYNMRKAGLAEAGEFCTENLAFKKLRNEGCMDKLRQIKKEQVDKQLSLESYNESLEQDVKELTKTDDYYKVDGSRVSIKNGFGSQVELMDLQNLGKKLEKKGYKVYCSNYYIDAKKNESIKEELDLSKIKEQLKKLFSWAENIEFDINTHDFSTYWLNELQLPIMIIMIYCKNGEEAYKIEISRTKVSVTLGKTNPAKYLSYKNIFTTTEFAKDYKTVDEVIADVLPIFNKIKDYIKDPKIAKIDIKDYKNDDNWEEKLSKFIASLPKKLGKKYDVHQTDETVYVNDEDKTVFIEPIEDSTQLIKIGLLDDSNMEVTSEELELGDFGKEDIQNIRVTVKELFNSKNESIKEPKNYNEAEDLPRGMRTKINKAYKALIEATKEIIKWCDSRGWYGPRLTHKYSAPTKKVCYLWHGKFNMGFCDCIVTIDWSTGDIIYNIETGPEAEVEKKETLQTKDLQEFIAWFKEVFDYEYQNMWDDKNESIKEDYDDIAVYNAPEEELYELSAAIRKYGDGRYYINFHDKKNGEGNLTSCAGPYNTKKEAKQAIKRLRPDYTETDAKYECLNKLEETLKKVKDMEINEGMWASPFIMENAKQVAELLSKPITYKELNSEEGKQKVWNIIGDDEFWDNVADEALDNPEEDARYLIVKFLEDWMERKESFNDDAYSQDAENIVKKAISMFNGITEDMATLEKKVDTADNDLHDIITSLENTMSEALEESLDEPIEDEFELIRDALRQYSELDDCFIEGYVTIEDIKNNYGLQDYADSAIIACAKEEGYEVDGDKILDPSL